MPRHSGVEGNIATSKSKIIWPFLRQKNTLPWNPLCPSWYKPWSLCSCLEDFLSKCQMSLRQKHLGGALPWVQGFVHFSSWLIYFTHLPFPCISWLFWGTIPLLNKTCWLKSMTSCDKSCAWENLGLSGWGEFLLRKPTHPWGPDSNRWRQSTLWCIWKQHSRKKKKKNMLWETWDPPWGLLFDVCVADMFAQVAKHVLEFSSTKKNHKSLNRLTHFRISNQQKTWVHFKPIPTNRKKTHGISLLHPKKTTSNGEPWWPQTLPGYATSPSSLLQVPSALRRLRSYWLARYLWGNRCWQGSKRKGSAQLSNIKTMYSSFQYDLHVVHGIRMQERETTIYIYIMHIILL